MFNNKKIKELELKIEELERQMRVCSKYVEKAMDLAQEQVIRIANKYLGEQNERSN